jgi:hypothetical protein
VRRELRVLSRFPSTTRDWWYQYSRSEAAVLRLAINMMEIETVEVVCVSE